MKAILAFFIFAICLVAMPPGPVQASDQPTGACFVLQVDHAPAATIQLMAITPVTYFVCNPVNATVMVAKEGGNVVEISLKTLIDANYLNKELIMSKVPANKMVNNFDLRTCLTCKVFNSQNLQAKKIQSDDPVKIRADTSI